MMLGYVTLGTDDPVRARAFYGALFGMIGVGDLVRLSDAENGGFTLYANGWGQPGLAITRP